MPKGLVVQNPVRTAMAMQRSRYRDTVLATGPVSYYGLDEPVGATTAIDSKAALNGAYVGSPSLAKPSGFGGQAVQFDGVDDAITFANTFGATETPWSVELLVRPTQLTQAAVILGNGYVNQGGVAQGWGIGIGTSNAGQVPASGSELCYFIGSAGTGGWNNSAYIFTATNWVHIVVAHATNRFDVYVNGVAWEDNLGSQAVGVPATVASIGAGYGTDHATLAGFFAGYIDEVAIYNKRLSLAVAQLHYEVALGATYGLH